MVSDKKKTKAQLVNELVELRQRIEELQQDQKIPSDAALQRQVRLAEITAEISTDFINVMFEKNKFDRAVFLTLDRLSGFADVDRSYVYLLNKDEDRLDNTHLWHRQGVRPQDSRFHNILTGDIPWWMEQLNRFETIIIPRVSDLPPEASGEKEVLQAQDVQSMVAVPLLSQGVFLGLVGFDYVRTERTWPEGSIALLKVVANVLSNALMRKQTADERTERMRMQQLMLDALPFSVMLIKRGHVVFMANEAARQTGVKPGSFCWRDCAKGEFIPEEHKAYIKEHNEPPPGGTHCTFCLLDECLDEQELKANRNLRLYDDRILEEYWVPLSEELCLNYAYDVTDERRLVERERAFEEQMRETQKLESLGILAGGIAHDFNNLLVGILGSADAVMNELPPDSPAREDVSTILEASARAAELARQMLAYSGKGHFVVKPLDMTQLVKQMGRILESGVSKKVVFQYDLAEGLPAVRADASQMRQIVLNLAINAAESMCEEGGCIRIATSVNEYDQDFLNASRLPEKPLPGHYVCLQVADDGCGMDKETLARIFDPFYSTKFTGRGLGLSATLGIVRGHEGALMVESEPGKGAAFSVLLPALDESAPAPDERPPTPISVDNDAAILLVDDQEIVRDVAQRMLESVGFTVLSATGGEEAAAIFREHADEIDCVLLDLTMPGISGEETYEKLRRIRGDVPVVISSGYAQEEIEQRFRGKDIAAFIQKPYECRTLAETLSRVL